jgi:FkbM family methyltransferase
MKKFDKWMFPDHEEHLQNWMRKVNKRVCDRLTYQHGKYISAMALVKNKKLAIDVGAHVGLWSYYMAKDFARVVCFEPMPAHVECWNVNMADVTNAELWEYALGFEDGFAHIATRTPDSSGDTGITHPDTPGAVEVPIKCLDFFNFDDVGFIKIDCEGFEEFVLRGGEQTLLRCKPVVLVEQKRDMSKQYGFKPQSAVAYLESLGAVMRQEISGDYILSWD